MYCTKSDLLKRLPAPELTRLTDDSGTGVADDTIIDAAIEDAGAEVDTYCADSCSVPFKDPVPLIIRHYTCVIAIYLLYTRSPGQMPADRAEDYRLAREFLAAVKAGQVRIGTDDSAGDASVAIYQRDTVFTDAALEDY